MTIEFVSIYYIKYPFLVNDELYGILSVCVGLSFTFLFGRCNINAASSSKSRDFVICPLTS